MAPSTPRGRPAPLGSLGYSVHPPSPAAVAMTTIVTVVAVASMATSGSSLAFVAPAPPAAAFDRRNRAFLFASPWHPGKRPALLPLPSHDGDCDGDDGDRSTSSSLGPGQQISSPDDAGRGGFYGVDDDDDAATAAAGDDMDVAEEDDLDVAEFVRSRVKPGGCLVDSAGLTAGELAIVRGAIDSTLNAAVATDGGNICIRASEPSPPIRPDGAVGATGRVVRLGLRFRRRDLNGGAVAPSMLERLRISISTRLDDLVHGGSLAQPVLVSVELEEEECARGATDGATGSSGATQQLARAVEAEARTHSLCSPVHPIGSAAAGSASAAADHPAVSNINGTGLPTRHYQLDGAMVDGKWDVSDVCLFDDLVDDDLRRGLLRVVNGDEDDGWDDVHMGPNPTRWERGGLRDVAAADHDGKEDVVGGGDDGDAVPSWGLRPEAIEDICYSHHDAIAAFEALLQSAVFPRFALCRMPEAVYGEGVVSPLTANAATASGETFDWHVDADPAVVPPSPWCDVYGRYPNRSAGRPRFVSCLVYLNDAWDGERWGACTEFLDPPTGGVLKVQARPGRVVVMDQDVTHRVTAPVAEEAGRFRPRYSLVWKLVLHPREHGQDMALFRDGARTSHDDGVHADTSNGAENRPSSYTTTLFGSAARPE